MDIRNGDCLELIKTLPDKSVDLLICDLPYGETNCKWDTKIDMVVFWKEFKRIRKSKRTACIHFCSTKFGYQLIKSWENGFKMDIVWKKRNKTGGILSRNRPLRNHEMVYFFYEQSPKYNRDKYHKRIVALPKKKEKQNEFGWNIDDTNNKKFVSRHFEPVNPVCLFESSNIGVEKKRHHQTEKPQDILEFFLKYWSDEDDIILDPTMGSGSTGVACKTLNRKFIGFELDEKIFEVAKSRLK